LALTRNRKSKNVHGFSSMQIIFLKDLMNCRRIPVLDIVGDAGDEQRKKIEWPAKADL